MRRHAWMGLVAWLLVAPEGRAQARLEVRPLHVTEGQGMPLPGGGMRVEAPRMRAVALEEAPDPAARPQVAELRFVYRGASRVQLPLQSGELRRQVGLKLRARDGCNVLYVMWRLLPQEELVVSVKHNPGQHRSDDCGNGGYQTVAPRQQAPLPAMGTGTRHVLRAELRGTQLKVWVDGTPSWEGTLPPAVLTLEGPVGLRSDNGRFDLELHASP